MISNKRLNTKIKKTIFTCTAITLLLGALLIPTTAVKAAELDKQEATEETTEATAEPVFDAAYYASQNPDVVAIFGNSQEILFWHYTNYGKAEGRFGSAEEAALAAEAAQNATETEAEEATPAETVKEGNCNILAIGNSITLHPVCSYWWGSWGMAASSIDKDYIHQVQAGLLQKYETVNLDILSVQSWEASANRTRQLAKFDAKLANDYDLVIIQLGENVNDMSTFKKDFSKLVSYVKEAQPDARIVVVGDYWYRSGRDSAKKTVAVSQGCDYVDISAIRGKKAYRAASGSKVLGDDGKYHTIRNQAVLNHPNDAGMKYIADKILETISSCKTE